MSSEQKRFSEWKQLLSLPSYRLRLLVFVLFGIIIFLVSHLVENRPALHEALIAFGVAFSAVALVSFIWDFLGGDPLELKMKEHVSMVGQKVDDVHRSLTLSSDLLSAGMDRLWTSRGVWSDDSTDGLSAWKKRLCGAKSVSIVSSTLWGLAKDEPFIKSFFSCLNRGTVARIVIYHPESRIVLKRSADERDRKGQMKNEIKSSLSVLAEHRQQLSEAARANLEIGLTTDYYHFAQILRADDRMLVVSYLSGKPGTPSPTSQLRGPSTPYFVTYSEQIDVLWERSQKLNDDDFAKILGEKALDVVTGKQS